MHFLDTKKVLHDPVIAHKSEVSVTLHYQPGVAPGEFLRFPETGHISSGYYNRAVSRIEIL